MEECDLLRERFHAITAKHRIQDHIHQKKLELDKEKLKLQHLRKKTLKEQWLLQDFSAAQQQDLTSNHNQTRALQLSIHSIEKEVECLERQESLISANECFILNRLKALEKGPDRIIKEAHDSFVSETSQVMKVIPAHLDVPSPPAKHHEPRTQERGSHNRTFEQHEVEQSPGGATVYCQIKQQNYHQNPNKRKERDLPKPRDERDQTGRCRNHVARRNPAENDFNFREHWKKKTHNELCYCHHVICQKGRGHHHGNWKDPSQHSHGMTRSSSVMNESSFRSHDHEVGQSLDPDTHLPFDTDMPQLYCHTLPALQAHRAPSPLLADDSPYTILSSLQSTEPITAIFMGFQTAQDDSEQLQEFEGILKAELIIIQDNNDCVDDYSMKDVKAWPQVPTGKSASRNVGVLEAGGERWKERQLGVQKVKKRQQPCCSVC